MDGGGEQGTLATQLLQASGMACSEQWAPPGQGWSTLGQTARLGPWAELVIENGCEAPGWTSAGGHGMRMGLSQQRPLQGKEPGSPVGMNFLRSL